MPYMISLVIIQQTGFLFGPLWMGNKMHIHLSWLPAEIKSPEGFSSGLIYMRETKEFLRSRICEGLHAQVNWFLLL